MRGRFPLGGAATRRALETLQRDGYAVLRSAMPVRRVQALHEDLRARFEETPFCRGDFYGARTKRFGALLRRSEHAAAFALHRDILAIADAVLGPHCDCYQLNFTQGLEIHPGQVRQAPHRDQDMWRAQPGAAEYLINVMWPFTPYTKENGATLIYPGSHLEAHDPAPRGKPIAIEMAPGDVLVFLGSTLHGAGANRSAAPRTGIVTSYCLGWLKPFENQWLVYPPEVARGFQPELQALVGYREHRPNLGNYEGQCPSVLLREAPPSDCLAATDNFPEHQINQLASFRAAQSEREEHRGGVYV